MSVSAFTRLSGMPASYFDAMAADHPAMDESALRVFLALRAAARRIENVTARWLEPSGLTATKMDVLHLVASSKGGTSVSRLRDHLLMTQPNVTFVVGGLERDGYVRRSVDPRDRRSSIVRLTAAGRHLIARVTRGQLHAIEVAVGPLPLAERDVLVTMLAALTESFEATPLP